jgi:SAM-dependent methyltransferase
MRRWLGRWTRAGAAGPRRGGLAPATHAGPLALDAPPGAPPAGSGRDAAGGTGKQPAAGAPPPPLADLVFAILLGREPSPRERDEVERMLAAGTPPQELAARVLASTEFRLLLEAARTGEPPPRSRAAVEQRLQAIGEPAAFVEAAYRIVLGREADPEGLAFYRARLDEGHARVDFVRTLLASDEFEARYARTCPQAGVVPRDVQLCELANPAKWDNPEWLGILKSLGTVPADKQSMHRKAYEFAQLLFGLTRLGAIGEETRVLSVGAGHEPVLYWLANRVGRVVATDMYEGVWQAERAMEGDASVLSRPDAFAPFEYRRDRLIFLKMDGRALAFADGTFDVAYSLSSVEHFGGFDGARAAVAEMARVLRPGGVLALATEYCLGGPPHHEAFQPEQVRALVAQPGLRLVQPIDEQVWSRYEVEPVDLRVNPYQTPHMVVTDLGSVFTSVMVFLERTAG